VNERFEGIHVMDNVDPKNPRPLVFIEVPGCIDVAVKSNILYADNVTDLVSINIGALPSITVGGRVENVFPHYPVPPDGLPFEYDASKGVVVKWVK
jgi:hypothetical protein